ncbi:cupin domain-containing protein [Nocardia sp. NPDC059091]|uniref:cupin domain-containing protein n=1 Tax=Nocardia sp. NPDC059091 TaxID=3346724 RepID=UPI0036CE689E
MSGQAVFGDHLQLTIVRFAPGAVVPVHTHPQEQIGLLLHGDATVQLGRNEYALHTSSAYVVPSGVAHGLHVGSEGAVFIEAFHPIRQDYLDAAAGRPTQTFR